MLDPNDFTVRVAAIEEIKKMGLPLPAAATAKLASKGTGRFGVPLLTIVDKFGVNRNNSRVPDVLDELIKKLEPDLAVTGLFRINGSASRMKAIETALNQSGRVGPGEYSPHDYAGLLKLFLRRLPDPLLTLRLYHSFAAAGRLADPARHVRAVQLLCLDLPPAHLYALRELMAFLARVAQAAPGMTAANLAAILTPNILRPHDDDGHDRTSITTDEELDNHKATVRVVETLIGRAADIGVTPPGLSTSGINKDAARELYAALLAPARKRGGGGCCGGGSGDGDHAADGPTAPAIAAPAKPQQRPLTGTTSVRALATLHGSG